MRIGILTAFLVLTACTGNDYRPDVLQPQDAKYENDLKYCIQNTKEIRSNPDLVKSIFIGLTGPLGAVALSETKDPKDPYFKNGYELTNECMQNKGYALK